MSVNNQIAVDVEIQHGESQYTNILANSSAQYAANSGFTKQEVPLAAGGNLSIPGTPMLCLITDNPVTLNFTYNAVASSVVVETTFFLDAQISAVSVANSGTVAANLSIITFAP